MGHPADKDSVDSLIDRLKKQLPRDEFESKARELLGRHFAGRPQSDGSIQRTDGSDYAKFRRFPIEPPPDPGTPEAGTGR
jgi:hypothetical protein